MKTKFYIIPEFGSTCKEKRYMLLFNTVKKLGYKPIFIKPDWYKPISKNIFEPEKDAIIFGFSYGAMIAYLISRKYKVKKLILASFCTDQTWNDIYFSYTKHMGLGKSLVNTCDIKRINFKIKPKTQVVTLVGGEEQITRDFDFIIPQTGHYLTKRYVDIICKFI